jgi:hypothetical protein
MEDETDRLPLLLTVSPPLLSVLSQAAKPAASKAPVKAVAKAPVKAAAPVAAKKPATGGLFGAKVRHTHTSLCTSSLSIIDSFIHSFATLSHTTPLSFPPNLTPSPLSSSPS